MGWSSILSEQLRYVIGDLDSSNYTYSDNQLAKFLGIGARFVLTDLNEYEAVILGPYAVDTSASGDSIIDPSPLTTGVPVGFSNLIVTKSTALIAGNELRVAGRTGGWKISDDKSTIDGTQAIIAARELKEYTEGIYLDMLHSFLKGEQTAGQAVLTPYGSSNYPHGNYPPSWFGCDYRR